MESSQNVERFPFGQFFSSLQSDCTCLQNTFGKKNSYNRITISRLSISSGNSMIYFVLINYSHFIYANTKMMDIELKANISIDEVLFYKLFHSNLSILIQIFTPSCCLKRSSTVHFNKQKSIELISCFLEYSNVLQQRISFVQVERICQYLGFFFPLVFLVLKKIEIDRYACQTCSKVVMDEKFKYLNIV